MSDVTLLGSSGNGDIDAILQGVVDIFETVFPNRVRGYYIIGSYADGSALPTSDIDGFILFKDDFIDERERDQAGKLLRSCGRMMSPEFDMLPMGERLFLRHGSVNLKLDSLLVFGEDVRQRIPLIPLDFYTDLLMHDVYRFLSRVRGNPPYLTYPVNYPDPEGEFYGYDCREVRAANGTLVPGTKEIINCVGKAALAIVTLKAKVYVKNKNDCLTQYKLHINDEWTHLLQDVYDKCRNAWNYGLPEDEEGRRQLKDLCGRTLAFENHFLALYKDFLLEELGAEEDNGLWLYITEATQLIHVVKEALSQGIAEGGLQSRVENGEQQVFIEYPFKIRAARMLAHVIYPEDDAVVKALNALTTSENRYLREVVEGALKATQMPRKV